MIGQTEGGFASTALDEFYDDSVSTANELGQAEIAPWRNSGKNAIMNTKKTLIMQWPIYCNAGVRL